MEIKEVLSNLCKLLSALGLQTMTPEVFRKSKFNDSASVGQFWLFMVELLILSKERRKKCHMKITLEQLQRENLLQSYAGLILRRYGLILQICGSQDLILAFGWLLSEVDILNKVINNRIANTIEEWMFYLHKFKFNVNNEVTKPHENVQVDAKTLPDLILSLFGRLRLVSQNLHTTAEKRMLLSKAVWTHLLNTQSSQIKTHSLGDWIFTGIHFKNHLQFVKEEQAILKFYLKWKENEQIFWDWMETVRALKRNKTS